MALTAPFGMGEEEISKGRNIFRGASSPCSAFFITLHLNNYYGILFIIIAALVGVYGTIYGSALVGWEHFLPSGHRDDRCCHRKAHRRVCHRLVFPQRGCRAFFVRIGAIVGLGHFTFFHRRYFPGGEDADALRDDWKEKIFTQNSILNGSWGTSLFFALLMTLLW